MGINALALLGEILPRAEAGKEAKGDAALLAKVFCSLTGPGLLYVVADNLAGSAPGSEGDRDELGLGEAQRSLYSHVSRRAAVLCSENFLLELNGELQKAGRADACKQLWMQGASKVFEKGYGELLDWYALNLGPSDPEAISKYAAEQACMSNAGMLETPAVSALMERQAAHAAREWEAGKAGCSQAPTEMMGRGIACRSGPKLRAAIESGMSALSDPGAKLEYAYRAWCSCVAYKAKQLSQSRAQSQAPKPGARRASAPEPEPLGEQEGQSAGAWARSWQKALVPLANALLDSKVPAEASAGFGFLARCLHKAPGLAKAIWDDRQGRPLEIFPGVSTAGRFAGSRGVPGAGSMVALEWPESAGSAQLGLFDLGLLTGMPKEPLEKLGEMCARKPDAGFYEALRGKLNFYGTLLAREPGWLWLQTASQAGFGIRKDAAPRI